MPSESASRLRDPVLVANAVSIAYGLDHLLWQHEDRFDAARELTLGLADRIGLADVTIPRDRATLRAERQAIEEAIATQLEHAQADTGETAAVPLFRLVIDSAIAVLRIALDESGPNVELFSVSHQLVSLGLRRDLAQVLERDAQRLSANDAGEISASAVLRIVASFTFRVVDELEWPDLSTQIARTTDEVSKELREFRDEYRETSKALQALIRRRDGEVVEALDQVRAELIAQGVDARQATELTEGDPASISDRVVRWLRGKQARDALEEALWAALEFVPGGTGVKLGVKIAAAVRKSLKA